MNKKLILVISCVGLILIAILIGGAGALWFLFLRQNPNKAIKRANKYLLEERYYQYETEGDFEMSFGTFKSTSYFEGEGKVDNREDKEYANTIYTTDGLKQEIELYLIGNTGYMKVDDDNFEEFDYNVEDEVKKVDQLISELIGQENYEVLDDEKMNGKPCYKYKLGLDSDQNQFMVDYISATFTQQPNSQQYSFENMEIGKTEIYFWVSKETSYPIRLDLNLEDVKYKMEADTFTLDVKMDMTQETILKDWGKEFTIKAPK